MGFYSQIHNVLILLAWIVYIYITTSSDMLACSNSYLYDAVT